MESVCIGFIQIVGFKGPQNFETVDKQLFHDNFDSERDRICDDYHTLILGNDVEIPSRGCENHQLFDWIKTKL